jgi:histidinol-phosphate/aromatic aminotransferase/cobyric acid decarboxylase-like protein
MAQLERTLAEPRNTLLLLCSPHNPTGKVWRREELETMALLCEKHGVKVISDEIHMDMVGASIVIRRGARSLAGRGRCSPPAQKLQYSGVYRGLRPD